MIVRIFSKDFCYNYTTTQKIVKSDLYNNGCIARFPNSETWDHKDFLAYNTESDPDVDGVYFVYIFTKL